MSSQVIGSGPIGFTDKNGSQKFIPLSALEFVEGEISAGKWPDYAENKAIVDALIEDLIANKFLRPAPSPPPRTAMVLRAAVAGAAGNKIRVTFSNLKEDTVNPDDSTFDAKIMAEATYENLSWDSDSETFIETVLGTDQAGTRPCWIRVREEASDSELSQPKQGSYVLEGGSDTKKSSKAIGGVPPGTAFTVEAWQVGVEGNHITVEISNVVDGAKTFTLLVKFEQSIKSIKLSKLASELAGSKLVLEVAKAVENFALPTPGTVWLNGGSDAQTAVIATAAVVAKT